MTTLEVNIPFDGFYNSFYSEEVDREEERFVEHLLEDGQIDEEQAAELSELLWRNTRYEIAYFHIAEAYTLAFREKFKEWSGVDLNLAFVEMTSPREYNFKTDRIFAKADEAALRALRAQVDEAELRAMIKQRFTSYDGFISFYPNRLEAWPEDVAEWDENHLCTLLMCFLPDDWEWDMYYATFPMDGAYAAWEKAVNWKEVDAFLEQCKENVHE